MTPTQPSDPQSATGNSLESLVAEIDREVTDTYGASLTLSDPQTPDSSLGQGEQESYIAFRLGTDTYAAPVGNVSEVLELHRITAVPNVPPWVIGVANLRGEIISVVELGEFLGIGAARSGQKKALVSRASDDSLMVCLVVDGLAGMRRIDPGKVQPPPSRESERVTEYLRGVVETPSGMVSLFDFDQLLLSPAMNFSGPSH